MRATLDATLRMSRFTIVMLPWMVLTAAAQGQTRTADVLYTHFDDVPTRAYRVGDEVFVSLDNVKRWGWTVNAWADTVDIKAEGKSISVPMRILNTVQSLPLRLAIRKLGGSSDWTGNTDTLSVYGTLTTVRAHDGKIRVDASFGFQPKATVLTDPSRLVMDLAGVRLDPSTKLDVEAGVRVVQYRPNVVRIITDTPDQIDLSRLDTSATQSLQFQIVEAKAAAPVLPPETKAVVQDPPPTEEGVTKPLNNDVIPQDAVVPPITPVNGPIQVQVVSETDSELRLDIPGAVAKAPIFQKPSADTLEIVLPGSFRKLPDGFTLDSPVISSVATRTTATGTVLVFALARPLGAQLTRDASGIHIQLIKPNVGDGRLAGKLIVVDPGHGGKDTGATGGGLIEKNLTLKIGSMIASELSKAGATVIVTRKTDVFIPLDVRAQMAQDAHADLFVSCHINSTDESSATSGGITFHHEGRPVSKVLAECIQQEIARTSGMPSLGVWSDRRIYRTGFAVLRQTSMPGVLLELGFINNAKDRKRLVADDFQQSVAKAVVQGIKVFLGDAKEKDEE